MEPSERESGNAKEVRQIPGNVMIGSSTQEPMNQMGTRVGDHEPGTAVVENRLPREEEIVHAHDQEIQVPTPNGRLSSLSIHTEEPIEGTVMPNILPQLDGPASVRIQRRQPLPMTRRTTILGTSFPDDSDSDIHDYRTHDNRRYPGRRNWRERGGRPPDREGDQD